MAVNLQQLFKSMTSASPYPKSIKATVTVVHSPVNYTSSEERLSVLNCVVADSSKAVKVVVFDTSKFARFTEGAGVIIRNIISKPDTESLTVTSQSQVFPSSAIEVEASIREEGMRLFRPQTAEVVSIQTALASPMKLKVSIKGHIINEEAVQQVRYKDEPVDVKNIYMKDSFKPNGCRVALWRETTKTQCRPGDYVQFPKLVINTYRNEVSLQTTSHAYIEDENMGLLTEDVDIRQIPVSRFTAKVPDLETIEQRFVGPCNQTTTIKLEKGGLRFKEWTLKIKTHEHEEHGG